MKQCPICMTQYSDQEDFCQEHPEAMLQVVTAKPAEEQAKTTTEQASGHSETETPKNNFRTFGEQENAGQMTKRCPTCDRHYGESFDYCVEHPEEVLVRLTTSESDNSQSSTAQHQHSTDNQHHNSANETDATRQPHDDNTTTQETADTAQTAQQDHHQSFTTSGEPTNGATAGFDEATSNTDQVDDLFATMNGDKTGHASSSSHKSTSSQFHSSALELPTALSNDGWRLSENPPLITAAFSRYQIIRDNELAHFTLYNAGVLTTISVYEQLLDYTPVWLSPVLYHGTLTSHGQILVYDVSGQAASAEFQSLSTWLQSHASEARALSLLPSLSQLVTAMIKSGIAPLKLSAEDLYINPSTLQLLCDNHGALKPISAADSRAESYQNDLANSPLIAAPFAAPELLNNSMWANNSLVFSIGQILYQAYAGKPLIIQEILDANVPFGAIADHKLARILMGSLWYSAERWTLTELIRALGADLKTVQKMSIPNWANRRRDTQAGTGFEFGGMTFHRLEDVILIMVRPDLWEESIASLESLLLWMEQTSYASRATKIKSTLADASPDVILIRLCQELHPQAPLTWREYELDDRRIELTLRSLAHDVLANEDHASTRIEQLFAADLSAIFKK